MISLVPDSTWRAQGQDCSEAAGGAGGCHGEAAGSWHDEKRGIEPYQQHWRRGCDSPSKAAA